MTLVVRVNFYNTLAAAKYNKIQKKGFYNEQQRII